MRGAAALGVCLAALLVSAAAPQNEWQKGIAGENKDYAQIPHAMLKVQDAAYLGEGQSATLTGVTGKPQSWHWGQGNGDKGPGVLTVSLQGGKLGVTKGGKPVDATLIAKSIPIDTDVDIAGQQTQVGAGVPGWRIFVYNQKNPAAVNFKGVTYFPYDPFFRVTAAFIPDPKLPGRVFRTSRGTDKQFFHAGDAAFTIGKQNVTLPLYAETNDPKKITALSAFFTDGLTGKGAYGAGRYVDAEPFGRFPPTQVIVDFNNAYNPNCARSAFYTCPVAIDVVPLAVSAGERDPHFH